MIRRVQLYSCIVLFSDVRFMIGLVFQYHAGFQYSARATDRRVRGFREFWQSAELYLHDRCACSVLATALQVFSPILTSSVSALQKSDVWNEFVLKSCVNAPGGVSGVSLRLLSQESVSYRPLSLNPSFSPSLLPSTLSELRQSSQTFSGCYASGITLEKVD